MVCLILGVIQQNALFSSSNILLTKCGRILYPLASVAGYNNKIYWKIHIMFGFRLRQKAQCTHKIQTMTPIYLYIIQICIFAQSRSTTTNPAASTKKKLPREQRNEEWKSRRKKLNNFSNFCCWQFFSFRRKKKTTSCLSFAQSFNSFVCLFFLFVCQLNYDEAIGHKAYQSIDSFSNTHIHINRKL